MKTVKMCDASSMSHRKLEQAFREYIERVDPFSAVDRLELQRQEQEKQQNQQLIQAYQDKLKQLERKATSLTLKPTKP